MQLFGRKGSEQEHQDMARVQLGYQSVFGTTQGKEVLADLLRMFGYWEHDPEFPELRRAAIMLLDRGGWLHPDNISAIVDGYTNALQVNPIDSVDTGAEGDIVKWRQRNRTQTQRTTQ